MQGVRRTVLYVVFAMTGVAALTLQVLWQRVIALHSGVDLASFTTVIAAFLAGIGLGSLVGGWAADRLGPRRSLVAFALANLAIGLFAWVSVSLFYDLYRAQAAALTTVGAKFAFNAVLVLVPTTLMGLSLPLVVRGAVTRLGEAGALVGRLYAVNTLGAALGAAVAGWVLLGSLGFVATARVAGTANLVAAILVLAVVVPGLDHSRAAASTDDGATPGPPPVEASPGLDVAPSDAAAPSVRVWPWFVIYGLTGAVALGFELVFFRVVDSVMRANSYSFAHVLSTYLLLFGTGTALGAAVVRRTTRPARWFLLLQYGVGVSALVGMLVLVDVVPRSPVAATAASFLSGDGFSTGFAGADGSLNGAFFPVFVGIPLLIMGLPVLCMGAAFPCAQALVSQRMDSLGRHTGALVASNVAGNVVGTVLVGFVAIERLGTSGTYRLLAVLLLVPGVAAAATWSARRARVVVATTAVLVLALLVTAFPDNQEVWANLNGVATSELALAEDRSCATALKQVDGEEVLTVNGASQNNYPFDDFHLLIGLVPAAMHPDPADAMALGLGIGATPYGMAVDPRLDRVTTVELCGGELDLLAGLARDGAADLDRFLTDPRNDLVVGDGRDHLLRTDETYDVMVVDTLRPQSAFSGSLYSVEFYELVRDHLAPGGLMAQWAPSVRVANSVTEVFPHVVLFSVPTYDNSLFLVASNEPITFDREAARARLAAERDAFSPEQFAAMDAFLASAEPACLRDGSPAAPVDEASLNRDLAPRDEYFLNNGPAEDRPRSCG